MLIDCVSPKMEKKETCLITMASKHQVNWKKEVKNTALKFGKGFNQLSLPLSLTEIMFPLQCL